MQIRKLYPHLSPRNQNRQKFLEEKAASIYFPEATEPDIIEKDMIIKPTGVVLCTTLPLLLCLSISRNKMSMQWRYHRRSSTASSDSSSLNKVGYYCFGEYNKDMLRRVITKANKRPITLLDVLHEEIEHIKREHP